MNQQVLRRYLILDHEMRQDARLRDVACDVLDRASQAVYQQPAKE